MPYKDLERKKEWERQHRVERLARRRELRQIAADQGMTRPVLANQESSTGVGFLIPPIAGGALAAYSPKLGMGAGGLTLVAAAVWKRNWIWWFVGCVVLLIGLLVYFFENEKTDDSVGSGARA
jgi:hypothetical protein